MASESDTIIATLRKEKNYLQNEFGVVTLGLFGSYARKQEVGESDVDILVELRQPRFDWLAGLKLYLEEKLNKKVDLIRKTAHLKKDFLKLIQQDLINV